MLPMLIPLAMAAIGKIGGMIKGAQSGKKLDDLYKQEPKYTASPFSAQRMGMAQTLLNARMPGATAMERNIYGNQANQMANVNRNATDGSQALSLGSAAQGQTNQAFQNLGVQEQQDYYNRLQNLTSAQQGGINEGDKVHQDDVRRFEDLSALTGAKIQNAQTNWNSLANMGMGAATAMAGMGAGEPPPEKGTDVHPALSRNSFMNMQPQSTATNSGGYIPGAINPNAAPRGMQTQAYPPWLQRPYGW